MWSTFFQSGVLVLALGARKAPVIGDSDEAER
jgi:hypothetical protein